MKELKFCETAREYFENWKELFNAKEYTFEAKANTNDMGGIAYKANEDGTLHCMFIMPASKPTVNGDKFLTMVKDIPADMLKVVLA